MMRRCWETEPYERGTFDEIEEQLTSMLAGNFQELACHRYYQFVPTRDTEIAGVIKDCGLRSNRNEEQEADLAEEEDLNGIDRENRNMMQNRRRFSY